MKQNKKKKMPQKRKIAIAAGCVAGFLIAQWMFIGWRYNFGPAKFLGTMRLKGIEGNSKRYDFSALTTMENSPLEGRTVLFLGSSVTNGEAALRQSIPEYFAARMGCTAIREAVDGTTLCDTGRNSYIQRMLRNVPADTPVDLLICQLSTNDAAQNRPLGNFGDDSSTVTGAMEYIIHYAQKTWNCPVVFYTNARYESEGYAAMVARALEFREKYGIGVLDLWSDDLFNSLTEEQRALYMKDAIHPYKAGYRDWWGPELERQFCAWFEQKEER